jgi:ComF family protein
MAGSKPHPAYKLSKIIELAVDWIYPPQCISCESPGHQWCPDCFNNIKLIQPPICKICGIPLNKGNKCGNCLSVTPAFDALRSWGVYNDTLKIGIIKLKYQNNVFLASRMAQPLTDILLEQNWKIDLIIPVPLSSTKKRIRGYNQSNLLAKQIAWSVGLSNRPYALKRVLDTPAQVTLTYHERKSNVTNAFVAESKWVNHQNVLLIDDVATTGATLQACSEALKQAGAKKVYCLTIARTLLFEN